MLFSFNVMILSTNTTAESLPDQNLPGNFDIFGKFLLKSGYCNLDFCGKFVFYVG